jgi:hypothetical protein
MKKLTTTQEELLTELDRYISDTWSLQYDKLEKICDCKSFTSSFNVLLSKGYVEREDTGDFSNRFKLTKKEEA